MRPVLKDATLLKNYLATFDHTGDGRQTVVVYQAVWNRRKGDPVVEFFRNGTSIPAETGRAKPANPRTVPVNRRDGTAPLTVQAILQPYRPPRRKTSFLRVLLDVDVATELLRVLYEDRWNELAPHRRLFPVAPPQVAAALATALGVDKTKAYSADYGEAKDELAAALGNFCSYCESPLQNARDLDVEHRLPKSFYPTEMLRWENFVLGCSLCNRDIKKANPSRAAGIDAAVTALANPAIAAIPNKPNKAPPNVTYHQIRQGAEESFLWPDVRVGGRNPSLLLVNYALYELTDKGKWARIDVDDAFNRSSGTTWKTTSEQYITTPIYSTTKKRAEERTVLVHAYPRRLFFSLYGQYSRRAGKTVQLVGLNRVTKQGNDRRMVARTEAWLKALRAVWRIDKENKRLQPGTAGSPELDEEWKSAVEIALQGFYSVWVTVFKRAGGVSLAGTLVDRLEAAAIADPDNRARYRGTDVNSVTTFLPNL